MKHEIIVALDVPSAREAAQTVARIGDAVSFYKVGLELFLADGPETLRMLKGEGKSVFLDDGKVVLLAHPESQVLTESTYLANEQRRMVVFGELLFLPGVFRGELVVVPRLCSGEVIMLAHPLGLEPEYVAWHGCVAETKRIGEYVPLVFLHVGAET